MGYALLIGAVAAAAQWTEGVHYDRLPEPPAREAGAPVEVVEVFWYGCPTCFNLEPYLQRWLEHKPDDVVFTRIAASLAPQWRIDARVYYVAEALGVTEQVHQALFDAIHGQGHSLGDIGIVADIFERHAGVDRERLLAAYRDFAMDRRMREADKRVRGWHIHGVPSLVVNGKYRTTPGRAQGYANTIELIEHLIELERSQ